MTNTKPPARRGFQALTGGNLASEEIRRHYLVSQAAIPTDKPVRSAPAAAPPSAPAQDRRSGVFTPAAEPQTCPASEGKRVRGCPSDESYGGEPRCTCVRPCASRQRLRNRLEREGKTVRDSRPSGIPCLTFRKAQPFRRLTSGQPGVFSPRKPTHVQQIVVPVRIDPVYAGDFVRPSKVEVL